MVNRRQSEVVIEKVIWGGYGLATYDDGRKILVKSPVAIFPGEVVQVELEFKSNYAVGFLCQWIKKSARRVAADCPYAYQCGGCSYWEAGDDYNDLKQSLVKDLIINQNHYSNSWQWLPARIEDKRFRIQIHFEHGVLGYKKWKSNEIVPVKKCLMAQTIISEAITNLRSALERQLLPMNVKRWELICDYPINSVWVVELDNCQRAWIWRNNHWELFQGGINYQLHGFQYRLAPGTFFQAIPTLAADAFTQAFNRWQINGTVLYDLYGGCGFISGLLAKKFSSFVVVESNPAAIKDCIQNLKELKVKTYNQSVENWFQTPINHSDAVIVLDPPRSGLHQKVSTKLNESIAKSLILIGCDGACFWRDIHRLAKSWQLIDLVVVDLFPNTPHCEFIGFLTKK